MFHAGKKCLSNFSLHLEISYMYSFCINICNSHLPVTPTLASSRRILAPKNIKLKITHRVAHI